MAYGVSSTNTPGSTLNFRQSPSTSSAVMASLPHGSQITITGPAQNGWFPVSIGQYTGYVSAQYVKPFSPTPSTGGGPSTPTTPPPTVPAGPYGTSTTKTPGSTLNLRQGPSTGTSVLGSIPHGASITITGAASNGWYPVTFNGKTGYVSAQYVNPFTPNTGGGGPSTPTTPPPTTPTTPPPGIPHTPAAPNTPEASNPFYNPDSTYGSHQNWQDTPLVTQTQDFDAEWERFLTDQGYGGTFTKHNIARGLIDRAKSGHNAATMNNPNLTPRDYLNQTLGPQFFKKQLGAMTPGQKSEMPSIYSPGARWNPR